MARLDHVVSTALSVSKAEARRQIRARLVRVDGRVVAAPSWQVVLGGVEQVTVEGAERLRPVFHRLLLMHKPRGCLTARPRKAARRGGAAASPQGSAAEAERTVFDVVPTELRHASLGPFGRLDKDTTGLLLLGSDGGLQALVTHPSGAITKQYVATLRPGFPLADDAAERVAAGLRLADGTQCAPGQLEIVRQGPPVEVRLTIHEGVNHQVKRMIGQLGGFVDRLHRVALGPFKLVEAGGGHGQGQGQGLGAGELPISLAEGEVRLATESELRALAALLPKDRAYTELAEAQREVSAKRESGKTSQAKGNRKKRHRGGDEAAQAEGEGGALTAGLVWAAFRRIETELGVARSPAPEAASADASDGLGEWAVVEPVLDRTAGGMPPPSRAALQRALLALAKRRPDAGAGRRLAEALEQQASK